jgi:hypothetical protein
MSTQDTDHIDPEYPGADEVRQFANRLRSTLGPEWIVDVGARRGDVPDEIVLMIRHPLVHGFQFGGDDVTELENAVGPFLRSEEYRLVQTFPAGRGTPDLVGHLRAGMGWWEIGPYQVFELCETLRQRACSTGCRSNG